MVRKQVTNIVSAKRFQSELSVYQFPFKALDPKYGRIEWCIEPIWKAKKGDRYYIEGLLIWAKQTEDKRYLGKCFLIPCHSEAITGDSLYRQDYLNHVWYWGICTEHKRPYMQAYPQNHHSMLEINAYSSISIDIRFK